MPKFTITFETPSDEAFEAAISALAEIYGGYQAIKIDPAWTRQPGKPDEAPTRKNSETREDFVRRKIFEQIAAQIVEHSSRKASDAALAEAEKRTAQAAASFTVGE